MHLMVATRHTQGQRDDDYARTTDGELAFLPILECDWGDPASYNRGARYFIGLESGKETTTAEIIDRAIEPDDIVDYVDEKLATVGWTAAARRREAQRLAFEMLGIAARYPPGTVVEKRGSQIRPRTDATQVLRATPP